MTIPRLLLVGLLALLPVALTPGDDDPVASTSQGPLTRADYGRWLVDRVGHLHLEDFVSEQVLVAEATARDLLPTPDEVEAAWQAELAQVLDRHYSSDAEAWADDLRAKGSDPEVYAERRRQVLNNELAHLNLVRAERTFTEEQLNKRYVDIYGSSGETISCDVLFFSAYAGVDPDGPRQDVQSLRQLAMGRARQAADALRAGASFDSRVADSDPLPSSLAESGTLSGNRIIQYRKNLLGDKVDTAVQSLDDPGDLAGPVQVWDGAYVLQLVERKARSFDEARLEMEAVLRATPPTAEELYEVRNRIVTQYETRLILR